MVERHFAWFRADTGQWIGEWCGLVPMPQVPPTVIGDARLMLLNQWVMWVTRFITPNGADTDRHRTDAAVWNLDAWNTCQDDGAACLDVSVYDWPCGDFMWSVFDGIDRFINFREIRKYIELTPLNARINAEVRTPRVIRSASDQLVEDITGTPLEPFYDQLFGQFVRRDGRLVFIPDSGARLPEVVIASMTDRNKDIARLTAGLTADTVPLHEVLG